METDLILSAINTLHNTANLALEHKDAAQYAAILDDTFEYTPLDGGKLNKRDYIYDLEKFFRSVKSFSTSHYRIKSNLEGDLFTEKIARKSVIIKPNLLVLSKKQTVQTEEIYHWKNIKGNWKVVALELVLEEKY